MARVLITGGTGLVGRALTKLFSGRGYQVIILSRQAMHSDDPQVSYATWDISRQYIDADAIESADYIVHLAGAGVADKRWTSARKQEIRDSRVLSSQLLEKYLLQQPHKVKKFISASATGFYGEDNGKEPFTENMQAHDDFLGNTCSQWEESVHAIRRNTGIPTVIFRTGIVLSREGGAIREFYKPLKLGFATILGNGEQMVSWIHIQDLVRLYFNAIVNDALEGTFNAVAPRPVSNRELISAMAKAAKGRSFITVHAPKFMLKLALGEMSIEVLKSCTVSSKKIQSTGFQFSYPAIEDAMAQLFLKRGAQD